MAFSLSSDCEREPRVGRAPGRRGGLWRGGDARERAAGQAHCASHFSWWVRAEKPKYNTQTKILLLLLIEYKRIRVY